MGTDSFRGRVHAVSAARHVLRSHKLAGDAAGGCAQFAGILWKLVEKLYRTFPPVEREFIGLYNRRPPRPFAGVRRVSYHELGVTVAQRVCMEVFAAAGGQCGGTDCIKRNWPAVVQYLARRAPQGDFDGLIADILDEAARAERRKRSDDPSGDGPAAKSKKHPRRSPGEVSVLLAATSSTKKLEKKKIEASVDARVRSLFDTRHESLYWSSRDIATAIGAGKSTVADCPSYKKLAVARNQVRLERTEKAQKANQQRAGRHRKQKASEQFERDD